MIFFLHILISFLTFVTITVSTKIKYEIVFQQYSDADIVLSKDWVPPITIAPMTITTNSDTESPARKKTNSVSFSLDSSSEAESGIPLPVDFKEESEKADTKKNKVRILLFLIFYWFQITLFFQEFF